jgi:DNA-binding IclR family transcriptional regulator
MAASSMAPSVRLAEHTTQMSGGSAVAGQTVTGKVFAILGAFSPGESRLTLTRISRRSGLPLATVHRLTGELVRWGALERDDDGTFRVGVRLWELGSLAPIRTGLRELAIPYMEDLYEATHGNVQLAVLDGLDALFVEKISGRDSVPIVTRIGGRLPLHGTGVGKVLLAYAPDEVLDGLLARGLERLTEHTIIDPDELRHNLDKVRKMGFAYTRDEMTMGSISVGAPVYGSHDTVVAAISIVIDSRSTDVARLAPVVRTAARGLSRRLHESWDGVLPTAP